MTKTPIELAEELTLEQRVFTAVELGEGRGGITRLIMEIIASREKEVREETCDRLVKAAEIAIRSVCDDDECHRPDHHYTPIGTRLLLHKEPMDIVRSEAERVKGE